MNAITAWGWQTPAAWPIARQWLLITLLIGLSLFSGYILLFYPNWQAYQRLICQTNELTEHNTSHQKIFATTQQNPSLSETLPCKSHLSLLLEMISQFTEQQYLLLVRLQQHPPSYQELSALQHTTTEPKTLQQSTAQQLIVIELRGTYTAVGHFISALSALPIAMSFDELALQQLSDEVVLKVVLHLRFYRVGTHYATP